MENENQTVKTTEDLLFNPYNPINQEITLSEVQSILTRYGITSKPYNIFF